MIGDTASPDMDTVTGPRTLTGDTIVTGGGVTLLRARMLEVSLQRLTDVAIVLLLPMETKGGETRIGIQLSQKGESLEIGPEIEGKKIVAVVNGLLTESDPLTEIAVLQDLLPTETGLGPQEAEIGLRNLTDQEQDLDPDLPRGRTGPAASGIMLSRTPPCFLK